MERTFHTPQPVELYVELGSGRIHAAAGDQEQTVVQVVGPRAEDFSVEQRDGRIDVIAPKSTLGSMFTSDRHDVTVSVPTGSDLATRAGSADTTAAGRWGTVQLRTGSGDVHLDDAEGSVLVESGSGDVRGHEIGGDLRVKSGSGDVDLGEVHGEIGISTGSGDVTIAHAHARASVKSGSGDTDIDVADADVSLDTASGTLTVRRAATGTIQARNVSGDVRVGVPTGTPVWTEISSITGRVVSSLESVGAPAEGQPYLEVRATTVSGDVHLQNA
jgi:DUF4097 and DUF4098 domain-containing protein YvlB